ncbi:hypothetical protein MNV49_004647 [Pseudohyphozyma bogoriensis]|nr:hypothetical protein MNV49_004647 [Pseudohyphozyma bogoriensis]
MSYARLALDDSPLPSVFPPRPKRTVNWKLAAALATPTVLLAGWLLTGGNSMDAFKGSWRTPDEAVDEHASAGGAAPLPATPASARPVFVKLAKYESSNQGDCPVPIVFTQEEVASDAYISSTFEVKPWADAKAWQTTVWYNLESSARLPHLLRGNEGVREAAKAAVKMTYDLDSTVPYTYLSLDDSPTLDELRAPPLAFEHKRKDLLVAAFISNCKSVESGRNYVFKELQRLLPGRIASYGKCDNNRDPELDLPPGFDIPYSTMRKRAVIKQYLFTLAFENTNELDYVTEKLYQPLAEGSVPISLGAPNVRDQFLPSDKSALIVREFDSVQQLADRILELAGNQTAYEEYLAWKTEPYSEGFQQVVATTNPTPLCALAMRLRQGWTSPFRRKFPRSHYKLANESFTLEDQGNEERFGGRKAGPRRAA